MTPVRENPGVFKTKPNYAGETVFVHPDLLEGTLREGFETLQSLTNPTARGIFTHTLLVMTYPVNDGNGRTSLIMMTKEFIGGGQCRIVVPAVYRNDYVDGLKAIVAQPTFNATIIARTLLEAQRIANGAVSPNLDKTIDLWTSTYAFIEDDKRARLSLPNPDLNRAESRHSRSGRVLAGDGSAKEHGR